MRLAATVLTRARDEGPGGSRTEHMQQESGYVGGVQKMAAGAEAFLEDAGCWQASLQNARELLEAAGTREHARVGGPGRRVHCPRAWLAPGSPEEGTTPRPAKEGWRWPGVISLPTSYSASTFTFGCAPTTNLSDLEYILTVSLNVPQDNRVLGLRPSSLRGGMESNKAAGLGGLTAFTFKKRPGPEQVQYILRGAAG